MLSISIFLYFPVLKNGIYCFIDNLRLRHSFTTRLLASLMPATWYVRSRDASIMGLSQALASDLTLVFEKGVEIKVSCLYLLCTCLRLPIVEVHEALSVSYICFFPAPLVSG